MKKNKNQQKPRHLIFYILGFLLYLISTSITCYKYRNKIQESNNKNLFFNVTVQISGQILNLLS